MERRNATAAVIGAGDFIGSAIAKKFAAEGFTIFAGRRNGDKLAPLVNDIEAADGRVFARSLDARNEADVTAFLQEADREAPLEICIFNIGANVNFPLLETTERTFRKVWEMACYSGLPCRAGGGAPDVAARARGAFLTGATASLRGGLGYAAFAAAKFGLRALAQSAARELGPKNIHVAHLVIDSGVDTEWVRGRIREREGEEALRNLDPDRLMRPAAVADTYWQLYQQPRDAWTFKMEIRPFGENGEAMSTVEFHFDFGSPNAYLSHLVMPDIERRTGARFEYVPVLLGGVFKLTNNRSPAESLAGVKNKPEYERLETERFVKRYDITRFASNPFFPVNTLVLMRGAVAARKLGVFQRYVDEIFRHMWAEPKKMDDPDVLRAALDQSKLDIDRLFALSQTADVKNELLANTQRSVERGTFGSPTFFVDDEIFFGKDHLRDVEEAIVAAVGARA